MKKAREAGWLHRAWTWFIVMGNNFHNFLSDEMID